MTPETPADGPTGARRAATPTRGFLFADLRGYTDFVERHGAVATAELLVRYRDLVRQTIARFEGAEIRTEGDSFYVVFEAVSQAVRAGLAIAERSADTSTEQPERPMRVGVGIHAGETVETPEGYVGTPVNIAARLCALAGVGEVLVSDTVRALTQTVLPVRFENRCRKHLKGVAEPVAVYAVRRPDTSDGEAWTTTVQGGGRRRSVLAVAAVVAGLAVASVVGVVALRHDPGLPSGPWAIGLDLPLSGPEAAPGTELQDAVRLAVDRANAAGGIGGARITVDARDDAGSKPYGQSPSRGAANARAFVGDPRVIAMVGPLGSDVAAKEIPITNAAGLLQCSPANTNPGLTKPRDGALDLRSAAPSRINYIRTRRRTTSRGRPPRPSSSPTSASDGSS